MPSYVKLVHAADPPAAGFYIDQHHFRDGAVMLYKRSDHKKPRWQARFKVGEKYITKSLKTMEFEEAKTTALEEYDELRFNHKHGMPIHRRSFATIVKEFMEFTSKRVDIGEITRQRMIIGKCILDVWEKYLDDCDITKITQNKVDGYISWRTSARNVPIPGVKSPPN